MEMQFLKDEKPVAANSLPDLKDKKTKGYPTDLLNPNKKGREWCLQYIKASYARHKNWGGEFSQAKRLDWITNRQYAAGNQNTLKYTNWLTKLKDTGGNLVSYLDLDWSIVKMIPKFRDVVLSYLDKIDLDIHFDAINPAASKAREEAKWQMETAMLLQPFFQEMEQKAGIQLTDPNQYIPSSKEELELFMQQGFRLPEEEAMELGVEVVQNENDWPEQTRLWKEDAIDIGLMVGCNYIDRISGRIKVRYCDPVNMILEDFRGHDGCKMRRIGEVRRMTVSELKLEAGDQFTEEEYYDLAKASCGQYNNPSTLSPFDDFINSDANPFREYDSFNILVLHMEWDSSDRYKWEKETNKYGNEMVHRRSYDTPIGVKKDREGNPLDAEVYAVDIKTVYTGKWIINTEKIYDYGRAKNITRSADNPREPQKAFKIIRIATTSIMDRWITWADSIQLTWLKLQNIKARAMPKGIIIEIGAFDNVFMDGEKKTAAELLQMAIQSGIIVYRRDSVLDDEGFDNNQRPPVEETDGGLGAEFKELTASMMNDIDMMRQVSGINEMMDASTPNPEQLVGTAKIALNGAQNAIYPLVWGCVRLLEKLSIGIGLNIQQLVQYGDGLSGYIPAIGSAAARFITIGQNVVYSFSNEPNSTPSFVQFGTRVQIRASAEMKQQLMQTAREALNTANDPTKGGIEYPDYMMVCRLLESGTNTKFIEGMMAHRIQRYKEKMTAATERNTMVQSQAIQDQTKVAAEQERSTAEFLSMLKRDEYKAQTDEDIRKLEAEYKYRGSDTMVKAGADIIKEKHKASLETSGK